MFFDFSDALLAERLKSIINKTLIYNHRRVEPLEFLGRFQKGLPGRAPLFLCAVRAGAPDRERERETDRWAQRTSIL